MTDIKQLADELGQRHYALIRDYDAAINHALITAEFTLSQMSPTDIYGRARMTNLITELKSRL